MGGASDNELAALTEYGKKIGLAFQIVDDILDIIGDPEVMGKPVGKDIVQGAGAIVAQNGKELGASVQVPKDTSDPIRDMLARLRDSGAVDVAMVQAREYSVRAIDALQIVPDSPSRRELIALVESAVQRQR